MWLLLSVSTLFLTVLSCPSPVVVIVVFSHVTSKANLTYKDFMIDPRHLHTYIKME